MTSPVGVIPRTDAGTRQIHWQARLAARAERPARTTRRLPLLIVATLTLWFAAQLK
jgi:hypothetical protein